MIPPAPRPFWSRDQYAARRAGLAGRARVTSFLRRWFDAKDFIEVQPAALQASPGNETHLHGFKTALILPDGSPRDAYLHTSPEFAMKKLLAAGEKRIYALTGVFRNRERTAIHAPEFSMLEWYRADAPLERLVEDCGALTALAAHVAGARTFVFRGREASPFEPPERLTVREAFLRYAGVDIYDSLPIGGRPDAQILAFAGKGSRPARRAGRWLVGYLQPAPEPTGRTQSWNWAADRPSCLPGERGGARAGKSRRPAGRRTVRILLLRG